MAVISTSLYRARENPFALYGDSEEGPPSASPLPASPGPGSRERSVSVISDGVARYTYFEHYSKRRASSQNIFDSAALRLGQIALALVALGVLMVVLQSVITVKKYWGYEAVTGFWCGITYLFCGLLSCIAKGEKNRTTILASLIGGTVAWVISWPVIAVSVIALALDPNGLAPHIVLILCSVAGLFVTGGQVYYSRQALIRVNVNTSV